MNTETENAKVTAETADATVTSIKDIPLRLDSRVCFILQIRNKRA